MVNPVFGKYGTNTLQRKSTLLRPIWRKIEANIPSKSFPVRCPRPNNWFTLEKRTGGRKNVVEHSLKHMFPSNLIRNRLEVQWIVSTTTTTTSRCFAHLLFGTLLQHNGVSVAATVTIHLIGWGVATSSSPSHAAWSVVCTRQASMYLSCTKSEWSWAPSCDWTRLWRWKPNWRPCKWGKCCDTS
jgi:hypothetical protein